MSERKAMYKTAKELHEFYKNDFENAVKSNEVLLQIAEMIQNLNDVADFGYQVAYILKQNKIISSEVFDVVVGDI